MIAQTYTPDRPVLLIDDSAPNLRLAGFLLKSEGLEVRTAESAERALELLAAEEFSLVLVDIQLPGMDGLELTRLIRSKHEWAGLPVVALTAYAMRGDEARMLAAGCDGYISKPIDTRSFPNQVRKYLKVPANDPEAVTCPAAALIKNEFLITGRNEARALLSLPDPDLCGPATHLALHRWAGIGGSIGLDALTDLAREGEELSGEPPAVRGSLIRQVLTSILALLESAG